MASAVRRGRGASRILLSLLALWSLGACTTRDRMPPHAPASPPDILLLMADQFRGDALGCAGHPAVRTPHLDRLAREGAWFRRAYSSTPSCTPARAALLTGMSPWGHGMLGYSRVAPRYAVELPELFRAAGYITHAVGKNHFDPQRATHGYEVVELDESGRVESEGFESDYRRWFRERAPARAPGRDPDATGLGWNDYRAAAYALPEELHPTRWVADRACAFLDAYDEAQPFLLKVSFARPHSPYDPPQRLLDSYADAEIPAAHRGAWSETAFARFSDPEAHGAARNNLGPELTWASRAAYYASITFIDEQVGRILDALERSGRLERTLIVFLSDHGDMLGDHHLWRKTYAYEGSARIPLILWWGDELAAARRGEVHRGELPRGEVRGEPVEIRDVLPTLLDGAGLPVPAEVEGRSLFDLLRADAAPWREVLDLEHATTYWPGNVWNALTDGRFKYVYHARDGREQLFDLDRDPGETRDLAPDPAHRDALAGWRARMITHLEPRGAPWVIDGDLGLRPERILHGPNYPR
ncbi:MAG: arylsulfatase [Planctomycetota bacterium]|jgi:arylsulfatase A-like enzyme